MVKDIYNLLDKTDGRHGIIIICIIFVVLGLVITSFGLNVRINSQTQKYTDLYTQHNNLVQRLAINLPGGAYIVEPLEEKAKLETAKLEVDITALFGNNIHK